MIVSSNWAFYAISVFLFLFNTIWSFFESRLPWSQRWHDVFKKKDIVKGAVKLAVFWVILFSASFVNVLSEDRTALNNATQEKQQLTAENIALKKSNSDLQGQLADLQIKESADSLRRRTVKLLNDLIVFWSKRPMPAQQPVQNPTTDEERQRNAKLEQYWRDATAAYENAGFRGRIREIVSEYKSKGVQTGYLEFADQYNRLVGSPFSAAGLEDCSRSNSELCTLRELPYHVDANDRPIIFRIDSK